jgi:hypothetical protein
VALSADDADLGISRDGGRHMVNGVKPCISGAVAAKIYAVMMRSGRKN